MLDLPGQGLHCLLAARAQLHWRLPARVVGFLLLAGA